MGLAEALKQKNVGKLFLAVSHGIFSRGVEPLLAHFERIFTTDSLYAGQSPGVEVISMSKILNSEARSN